MKTKKKLVLLVLAGLAIGVIIIVVNVMQQNMYVKSVDIHMRNQENTFIAESDVATMLENRYGSFLDKKIKQIDIPEVEAYLEQNPYIEKANVYINITGSTVITIFQRNPMVQIFPSKGDPFWMDALGKCIPKSKYESPKAIVASGRINCSLQMTDSLQIDLLKIDEKKGCEALLSKILFLCHALHQDPLLQPLIDQIYVSYNGGFELVPKMGSSVIELGSLEHLDIKLEKLKTFYMEALRYEGWDRYKKINLEFKDQVICSKK